MDVQIIQNVSGQGGKNRKNKKKNPREDVYVNACASLWSFWGFRTLGLLLVVICLFS